MIDICYGQQLSCVLLRAMVPCADFVVRLRSLNLGTQQFPTPASTAGRCCCFPMQRCQHFCVAFRAWFLEPELVGGGRKAGRQSCRATLTPSFTHPLTVHLHQLRGISLSCLGYLSAQG